MREVIRGVIDVLRASGVNRSDARANDDGETFVLPKQSEETREDTAYAASETREPTRTGRGDAEDGRRQRSERTQVPVATGRERSSENADAGGAGSRDTSAQMMQGVERMSSAVFEEATLDTQDALSLSDALARSQSMEADDEDGTQLQRGQMVGERLSEVAMEDGENQALRDVLNRGETTRRAESNTDEARALTEQRVATERARVVATTVSRRVVADQTAEANGAMGQGLQSNDDLVEEAEADAFDDAQAVRDGDGSIELFDMDSSRPRVQTAAQLFTATTATPTVDPVVTETTMGSSTTDTLMEEIMVAQRGPAGGDRIGDSDAIIRISEGAAGALQVKVKREGDDLSLRVRAEDLALRGVMTESLPDLKHELQKANLVEGQIEVQEDGIDDQMQSEYTWDGERTNDGEGDGERGREGSAVYDPTSDTTQAQSPNAVRHDGQLHVVA